MIDSIIRTVFGATRATLLERPMPRSSQPVPDVQLPAADGGSSPDGEASTGRGDVYTMAEAARLKGVSYHTVSRAVRRGKLPVQRLGRMALVSADDLRAWRPMRERAPRKYRRREPNPAATPALLDLASGEKVELAGRLSALYEVLHSAAGRLPLEDFLSLLCDRLASALDFRRVAVWGVDGDRQRLVRLTSYGGPFGDLAPAAEVAGTPLFARLVELDKAVAFDDVADLGPEVAAALPGVTSLFAAPLRVGDQLLGFVLGDCAGESFDLTPAQLGLAQVMASQAALALERARLRAIEATRGDQVEAVLDDLSEAVCACDADGRLTFSNAAERALLGIDTPGLKAGQSMVEVLALAQRRSFEGQPIAPDAHPLLRALAGEHIRAENYIVVRPSDGVELMVSANARPLYDKDGAITGAVSVARDITAERKASAQAAERLARLEAAAARADAVAEVALALNAGTDLRSVLQTAIGRLVDLLGGDSGAIFFREADGRMVGQASYKFGGPAVEQLVLDPASVPTTMVAFVRQVPVFCTYAEVSPSERTIFDQYGVRSATIAPLIVDGELIGVAYVNHMTEQHRPAPEDLSFAATLADQCAVAIDKTRLMERSEAAHRRLLAVVDQLPQGVVIVEGTSGQIALANRATEELLGTSLDNAPPGLGFGDADGTPFPPGEAPLERTLRTGQERFSETLTISRPDGSTVKVLANHAPVTDATGRIVGAVGVIQDIAQVTAIDRAKDEFLSVVAHELRNPLTSLRGNLQLLLRRVRKESDPARAEEADRLEAIILQSDRMAELVSRLLEVSRADLGRLDLSYGPSDAAAMVRRGVQSARGLSKEHRIVEETPATCPVVWDAVRIEQMLANLLSNAVKYTRGGEVRVTVTELPGDRVRIAVQDQGPGIPDAVKTRLFDRYYRAEADRDGASGASRPNTAEGLGLGLYISHKIVVAHGGDLTVEDAPEGGAVFVATLPRDASGGENTAVLLATTAPADHRA